MRLDNKLNNEAPLYLLRPFASDDALATLRLAGSVRRCRQELLLAYTLHGDFDDLLIPPPALRPSRRDRLWEGTCFECFFAEAGAPGYWEVNLSPAGHWNVYAFSGYRQGMREETEIRTLALAVRQGRDRLDLEVAVPLLSPLRSGAPLAVSLTAVLQGKTGGGGYRALAHPGERPDFHLRESFVCKL